MRGRLSLVVNPVLDRYEPKQNDMQEPAYILHTKMRAHIHVDTCTFFCHAFIHKHVYRSSYMIHTYTFSSVIFMSSPMLFSCSVQVLLSFRFYCQSNAVLFFICFSSYWILHVYSSQLISAVMNLRILLSRPLTFWPIKGHYSLIYPCLDFICYFPASLYICSHTYKQLYY